MPNGWKYTRINEICEITSSKRIFAHEYRSFGIPFYRGKEIIEKQAGKPVSNELYIDENHYMEIGSKHGAPQEGDLLLTSVGTLGIPYVVKNERFYFKDGNITWFRNFRSASSKYLYYWFLSPYGRQQIDSKSIGSTQKALTIDALLGFEFELPPLEQQIEIVQILQTLDDKIANNKAVNHHLPARSATDNSPDMSFGSRVSRIVASCAVSALLVCICKNIGLTIFSNLSRLSLLGSTISKALRTAVVMLGTAEPTFIPAKSRSRMVKYTNFATLGCIMCV